MGNTTIQKVRNGDSKNMDHYQKILVYLMLLQDSNLEAMALNDAFSQIAKNLVMKEYSREYKKEFGEEP